MMDGGNGGVDGLKWPFHEQTGMLTKVRSDAQGSSEFLSHVHVFPSLRNSYLPLKSIFQYLFAYLSSIRGNQMHLGVKCNRACLLFFFSRVIHRLLSFTNQWVHSH